MEHIMKLNENSFNDLKNGRKKREYRLYDEKRRLISVGDTIKFLKLPDLDEEYIVDVTDIEIFSSWEECYEKYFLDDFKERYDSISSVVLDTYNGYYSEEETKKYGCVIITMKQHEKTLGYKR